MNAPLDRLDMVRRAALTALDQERTVNDLEEQLVQAKARLEQIVREELVTLCDLAHIDNLGIEAEGNYPAVDLKIVPFYSANIPATWEPERRKTAFDWLQETGHGGLIQAKLTVWLDRDRYKLAQRIARFCRDRLKLEVELKSSVHHMTLSAWLKRQIEKGQAPPLETIGATVGRRAVLKPRKDKTHAPPERSHAY